MPDLSTRLLASCASTAADGSIAVDLGTFVSRLLLFETYVVASIRLQEVPALVEAFGLEGLRSLIASGALRFHCDSLTTAQVGQTDGMFNRTRTSLLPPGSYSFGMVSIPNHAGYVGDCMRDVEARMSLSSKEARRLRATLQRAVLPRPEGAGQGTRDGLRADLRANAPVVRSAVIEHVRRKAEVVIADDRFSVRVHPLAEDDYAVETNLGRYVPGHDVHKLVECALLDVAGVNQNIEEMKLYSAICSLDEGELPILQSKVDFLWATLASTPREQQLTRVLTIGAFPDLGRAAATGSIDVERLLTVRDTPECHAFRRWLRSAHDHSDDEIRELLGQVGSKVAGLTRTTPGRAVRWAVTTAAGFVPVVGAALGPIASAVDSFLVDRMVGPPGPLAFLNDQLRPVIRR